MNDLDRCHRIFAELELQRTEMLSGIRSWNPQLVTLRPAPDSWCAVEVLDHLSKSERGILNKVRSGLESPHTFGVAARLAARVKVAGLERALRSNGRFSLSSRTKKELPPIEITLQQVEERWEQTRGELREMLKGLRPEDLVGGVFAHPVAGWMTVPDVLGNLSAHLHHHTFQLERIAASLSGSKTS